MKQNIRKIFGLYTIFLIVDFVHTIKFIFLIEVNSENMELLSKPV